MLFGLRAEAELIDVVDDLAEVVAAGDLVLDLAEDLADFVFERVGAGGFLLEAVEIGEELPVDEVAEVVACQRDVVVDLSVFLGSGPGPSAELPIENRLVLLA